MRLRVNNFESGALAWSSSRYGAIPCLNPISSYLCGCAILAGMAILLLAAPSFWERKRNQTLFAGIGAAAIAIWLRYPARSPYWARFV